MFDTKNLTLQMAGGRAVPIEYDLPQSEVKKRCAFSTVRTEGFTPKPVRADLMQTRAAPVAQADAIKLCIFVQNSHQDLLGCPGKCVGTYGACGVIGVPPPSTPPPLCPWNGSRHQYMHGQ